MISVVGSALYQWDTGRRVTVTDIEADHVHFSNKGDSKAVVMDITDSQSKIPDYLFQTGRQLCVYVVKNGITIESCVFPVIPRERPENYIYEEDQRNYVYELIESAEQATEAAKNAAEEILAAKERGDFNGPQGPAGKDGEDGEDGAYVLRWSDFNGWEGGFDYDGALHAFRQGKVVVLHYSSWETASELSYICTEEMTTATGRYPREGLLFVGGTNGDVFELRLYSDGTWDRGQLLYDIKQKLNTLNTGFSQLPFKELTGTTSSPVVIRNLDSGVYLLNGKTKNISSSAVTNSVNDFYFVSNNGTTTYAIKVATSLHAVHQLKLTDTTAEFNQCRLDQILTRLTTAENKLSSYDTRIPMYSKVQKSLPRYAKPGEVVIVDPSGTVNADTTEAWVHLGFDSTSVKYIWKKLVLADVAFTQ